MGNYLDSMDAYTALREMRRSPYFVDKSPLLDELIPRIDTTEKYICITRPRRFGKSAAANMIAAFFSRSFDSKELFQNLLITESPYFSLHMNQYRVIFISLNETPRRCSNYERYIERIEKKLIQDLENAYPNAGKCP